MIEEIPGPVGYTKHTDLSLDPIAELQPGLGCIMPQVSERYWIFYYAAKGGNWTLATRQRSDPSGLLRLGAVTRPKYKDHLEASLGGHVLALTRAIKSEDWPAFERAYQKGIDGSNAYHRDFDHAEIEWALPLDPPKHLRLTP